MFANVVVQADCPTDIYCDGPLTGLVSYDGCDYDYVYCLCINEYNLHEVVLTDIMVRDPCNYENFELKKGLITDNILIDIAKSGNLETYWSVAIPECPDALCIVRWRDAICYDPDRWDYDSTTCKWYMHKCDDETRSCGETVLICWELINNEIVYFITRTGRQYGPECTEPCTTNCE